MTVERTRSADVEPVESTPGVARKTLFETDAAVLVQSRVEAGTTSGWHHHGDRHVFGYVLEGAGTVEYGSDGEQTLECRPGDYFYISPGTVHRDATPTDEDAVVMVCFVGTGPVFVNVDGPGSD